MVIDACYSFRFQSQNLHTKTCSIERLFKVGNNDLLNIVFENFESFEVTQLGPIASINGYHCYKFKNLGEIVGSEVVIFETSAVSRDIGLVKTADRRNAILFNIVAIETVEVYVFNDRYASKILLLQMLGDGALNDLIAEIKAKIIQ